MKKTHLLVVCALSLLAACEPTVANRGNVLDPDNLAQVKPGLTTREEVATRLGTPTEVSTFDEKVWYYIGRKTEQYSFLRPDVVQQQAVEVDFNEGGTVTAVKNLDLSQAADISPVERTTPTYGHDNTFLRQLLGDLSHPMPGIKDDHAGSGGTQ
jgi:outer membrane protein assembly factor BamE (lipoprotein component of BamABCDE complex)